MQADRVSARRGWPRLHEWLLIGAGLLLVVRYRWLLDDAFIYFRYVDNLLYTEAGLVFNAGEYVEGYSSPLHCLLLVVLRATGIDWMHAVVLLGGAIAIFVVTLVRRRSAARTAGPASGFPPPAATPG